MDAKTFNSDHPHGDNVKGHNVVSFPNSKTIGTVFSKESSTESKSDLVQYPQTKMAQKAVVLKSFLVVTEEMSKRF